VTVLGSSLHWPTCIVPALPEVMLVQFIGEIKSTKVAVTVGASHTKARLWGRSGSRFRGYVACQGADDGTCVPRE
jgi:hypothetical protein